MPVGNYGTFNVISLRKNLELVLKNNSKSIMKPLSQERCGNRTDKFKLGVKDRSLMSVFLTSLTDVVGPAYIRN